MVLLSSDVAFTDVCYPIFVLRIRRKPGKVDKGKMKTYFMLSERRISITVDIFELACIKWKSDYLQKLIRSIFISLIKSNKLSLNTDY